MSKSETINDNSSGMREILIWNPVWQTTAS